jgi:tetratricopeptide (TPR) repeat protein
MNSLWPRALPAAGIWRAMLGCSLVALCAPAPASENRSELAERQGRTEQVDVFPQYYEPAAPDLLLSKEEQKKADALAAYSEGLAAEDEADIDKALEQYRKALDLDPGYTELSIKMANELARRGDVSEGINTLKDAIKASPKAADAYIALAQLYARYLKKYDLALRYANQALQLDPKGMASYVNLFELYLVADEPRKAEQILDRAAKLDNNDPQFWLQLGDLYMRLLLNEDGSATPEGLRKMNAVFQKALTHGVDDAFVAARVGDFNVLSQQIANAIPLYEKVIRLKNDPSDPFVANVREKLARSYAANAERQKAIALMRDSIKDNPLRYESYELLSQLYDQEGELDQALGTYQQMLLLQPGQPQNYLSVADLYFKTKQFDKAADMLADARKRFPDLPQLTYSMAIALSQAKRHQEAVTAFEETLHEAEVLQGKLIDSAFYFNYGAAAEQAGLVEKAAQLFKKSIELDPSNSAQACNYLGYMWVDRGENLDEAGELIRRALELDPDNGAYMDSLGWLYFKKGEFEKALAQLLKAADSIKPEDPVVFDHIADTYQQLGNTAQAMTYWQKALTVGEPDKKIADKLENAKQKVTATPPLGAKPLEKR